MKDTDYKRLWRNVQKENLVLNNVVFNVLQTVEKMLSKEDYKKVSELVENLKVTNK